MTNQTGIDYDTLMSRIHGGVCAFQSLRSHRRDRKREDTPPSPRASASAASPPPQPPTTSSHVVGDEGLPVFEPQGFIAHEGRVLPLFGDVRTVFHGAPAPA